MFTISTMSANCQEMQGYTKERDNLLISDKMCNFAAENEEKS